MRDRKKLFKMSRRKDAAKVRRAKKNLSGLDFYSIRINSSKFINDCPCRDYKNLWQNVKNCG